MTIDKNDLYSQFIDMPLTDKNSESEFGRTQIEYTLRRHWDVRNLRHALAYRLSCRQRIIIPNPSPYAIGPTPAAAFKNYPAAMSVKFALNTTDNVSVQLQRMFPKTLNASVSTSQNHQTESGTSRVHQHTSGSTDTNANTYGVAVSAGAFGGIPTGGVSASFSHTDMHAHSTSNMDGSGTSAQSAHGGAQTMSIKDWSSYGATSKDSQCLTWTWGQTYPWDVIQYNHSVDGSHIQLPDFVAQRLLDGDLVLPPSELSRFGIDFTMTAAWLLVFPTGGGVDETVTMTHHTRYYEASHERSGAAISATLDNEGDARQAEYSSPSLDLSGLALDPIMDGNGPSGAAIGFTANPFTIAPSDGKPFKIVSPANTLQVRGKGFDTIMSAGFADGKSATIDLTFKITDTVRDYGLHLMGWIGAKSGRVRLLFTINERFTVEAEISSSEGQGGQNNITTVELRNNDITSINFHDYLAVGLNTVHIVATPVDPKVATDFTLFALSVEQE